MTKSLQETNLERLELGRNAQMISPYMLEHSANIQQSLVNDLVSRYNSDSLTTEHLWGIAGGMVVLHKLTSELEKKINQGIVAAETEFNNG